MKIAVVINPQSRSGKAGATRSLVESLALNSGAEVLYTERAGHATELARRAAQSGFDRVVAVGGDGTINEVMNGLVGTDTALAVVPAGTGNDWVRTVGVPRETQRAWQNALNGRVALSDVGEAVGHRYFLNVAGVGFDAEVAATIADAKGLTAALPPTVRYLACVFSTLARFRGADTKMTSDGGGSKIECLFLMAVAVAQFYGSGMKIAPNAVIDDGLFDVVWGRDVRKREVMGLIRKIYSGGHIGHAKVGSMRCQELTVESDLPLAFHLDGDVVGKLPVTFKVYPQALRIVVP